MFDITNTWQGTQGATERATESWSGGRMAQIRIKLPQKAEDAVKRQKTKGKK